MIKILIWTTIAVFILGYLLFSYFVKNMYLLSTKTVINISTIYFAVVAILLALIIKSC